MSIGIRGQKIVTIKTLQDELSFKICKISLLLYFIIVSDYFLLKNTSVIVEMYQISFLMFICAFLTEISSFFLLRVSSFCSYFCVIIVLLILKCQLLIESKSKYITDVDHKSAPVAQRQHAAVQVSIIGKVINILNFSLDQELGGMKKQNLNC